MSQGCFTVSLADPESSRVSYDSRPISLARGIRRRTATASTLRRELYSVPAGDRCTPGHGARHPPAGHSSRLHRRHVVLARLGYGWLDRRRLLARLRGGRGHSSSPSCSSRGQQYDRESGPRRDGVAGRICAVDRALGGLVTRSIARARRRPADALLRRLPDHAARDAPVFSGSPGGDDRRRTRARRVRRVDSRLAARGRRSGAPLLPSTARLSGDVLERTGGDGARSVLARGRSRRPKGRSRGDPRARAGRGYGHGLSLARDPEQRRRRRARRVRRCRLRRLRQAVAPTRAHSRSCDAWSLRGATADGAVPGRRTGIRRRRAPRRHGHARARRRRHARRPRVRAGRPAASRP